MSFELGMGVLKSKIFGQTARDFILGIKQGILAKRRSVQYVQIITNWLWTNKKNGFLKIINN